MASIFKKRVLAYIADYFVVTAILWIIAEILAIVVFPFKAFFVYDYFIILLPFFTLIYFIVLEKKMRTTVGKHLLFLKVVSTAGKRGYQSISLKQAIIRNLSKIYWLPIIIDLIIGLLFGSSNERVLGKISKTAVVDEDGYQSKLR